MAVDGEVSDKWLSNLGLLGWVLDLAAVGLPVQRSISNPLLVVALGFTIRRIKVATSSHSIHVAHT